MTGQNGATRAEFSALIGKYPEIRFVDAVMSDLCGILRGKRLPIGEASKLFDSGLQLPFSVHLMDARGEMANPQGRGFSDGDPDGTAWPLPGTVMRVWGGGPPRAQILMALHGGDGKPFAGEPRAVLARTLEKFRALDLRPVVALELEFYLIDQARLIDGAPQPPICPRTGARERSVQVYGMDDLDRYEGFLSALSEAAQMQRVPVSAASSEYAPGQFEANLKHQDEALAAADHAVLLRQIVKAAALSQRANATFMAKPYAERAGSGLHVHLSLLDAKGRNVFDDGSDAGGEMLRFAIGGLQAAMPESMAIFAPNANSYRRFAPDMFAPVNRRWGVNNRSAGLRVPAGPGAARRIEHRVAGADANPYLVLAAVLAGVHHGLAGRIDPGPPAQGNVSRDRDPALALGVEAGLAALDAAKTLPDYLGAEALALYRETKAVELARLRKPISNVEYDWYL